MIGKRLLTIAAILSVGFIVIGTAFIALAQSGSGAIESKSSEFTTNGVVTPTLYFPIIFIPPPTTIDLALFMIGDGRLYEVRHQDGSQERIQTQQDNSRFFHVKGENEGKWEELWATDEYIYRGTDTSPKDDGKPQYYTLRENGQYGSPWAPRYWQVGQIFERNPIVSFYLKEDCSYIKGGYQQSWLKFVAYYPSYDFPGPPSGVLTLYNVIQLAWLETRESPPTEYYFYAHNHGLVGWSNNEGYHAYVSEVHDPGDRDPLEKEVIPCLDTSGQPDHLVPGDQIGVLPLPYRAK